MPHSGTMRVGLHNPFLAALGGGEKYFLSILEDAVRLPGVDVALYAPQTPDPAAWERLNLRVPAGAFTTVEADDAEVGARSRDLDLLVAFTNDVPPLSHARRSVAVVQFPVVARERPAARLRAAAATLTAGRRARCAPTTCSSCTPSSRAGGRGGGWASRQSSCRRRSTRRGRPSRWV